jgi:hypothetical protein
VLSELLDVAGHRWRREQWDEPGRFVRTRLCEIGLSLAPPFNRARRRAPLDSAPLISPATCWSRSVRGRRFSRPLYTQRAKGRHAWLEGDSALNKLIRLRWPNRARRRAPLDSAPLISPATCWSRSVRGCAAHTNLLETSVYPASKGQTRVARGRFRLEQTDPLAMASANGRSYGVAEAIASGSVCSRRNRPLATRVCPLLAGERSGVQRSSSACSIEWGRETPRTRPREERSGAWVRGCAAHTN